MAEAKGKREGKGYWGRVLMVDLSNGKAEREELPAEIYYDYLGGLGLGAKVLWDRMKPGAEPLGPDNILGLLPGLLTDTGSFFTGRFLAVGRSPQTGGWGDANCGGSFSPALKRAGVDGAFFLGCSDHPVYLHVDENQASLHDASDLWGKDTIETERILTERHGKHAQVACIGPAGEGRSHMAGIVNDGGRIAARSGLGAVMGSKNLKAVVSTGRTRSGVVDKERMVAISKAFQQRIGSFERMQRLLGNHALNLTGRIARSSPLQARQPADLWRQLLIRFGTPALTAMSAESGDSPIRNWGGTFRDFPFARARKIGGESVIHHEIKKYGCYSCPIRCGGMVTLDGHESHKPEYETLCAFGGLVLNDDLSSIIRVNDRLNRAGMDTIACGATVAFAVECFENDVLTPKDTDGLELRWGNTEAILALVDRIIRREGIGEVLADGVRMAAHRIGPRAAPFAVLCGGVEPPMHDPKFDPGQAVVYALDATPGRHTTASYQYLELQNLERQFARFKPMPMVSTLRSRYRFEDKMEALTLDLFYKMLVDACGACLFGTQVGGDLPLCEWLNAATGWERSHDEYLRVGERIAQLRHCFNVREGLNPVRDFTIHPRLYSQPPGSGRPNPDLPLDMEGMARAWYRLMHWDPDTGRPDRNALEQLKLSDVARILHGG